jgi:hypothetical protein
MQGQGQGQRRHSGRDNWGGGGWDGIEELDQLNWKRIKLKDHFEQIMD